MKHVVNGSVGIGLKLRQVHWGTGTSAAVNGSYQGYVGGMPSREPSASSMLAWDDVSTGGTVTSDF